MGVKVKNLGAARLQLRLTSDEMRTAALEGVEQGADEIVERARRYAPVDEGNLEDAIRKRRLPGFAGYTVGVEARATGQGDKTVADYAMLMHELLEPAGTRYHLGPKSREKQAADPGMVVGGKYMERAADEIVPLIAGYINERVARAAR